MSSDSFSGMPILFPASDSNAVQPVGGQSAAGLRERCLREAFAHDFLRGDEGAVFLAAGDELAHETTPERADKPPPPLSCLSCFSWTKPPSRASTIRRATAIRGA